MNELVIAFCGAIKSGKTSLSSEVADLLGWPRVSFGDRVRAVARERGEDPSVREVLQRLGESLIDADARGFCAAVLAQAGSSWTTGRRLIVDGVRHLVIHDHLCQMVRPAELKLVHIDADRPLRESRMRHVPNDSTLGQWDAHSTEIQVVSALRNGADLIVDGSRPLETVVREVVDWIHAEESTRAPRYGNTASDTHP